MIALNSGVIPRKLDHVRSSQTAAARAGAKTLAYRGAIELERAYLATSAIGVTTDEVGALGLIDLSAFDPERTWSRSKE